MGKEIQKYSSSPNLSIKKLCYTYCIYLRTKMKIKRIKRKIANIDKNKSKVKLDDI